MNGDAKSPRRFRFGLRFLLGLVLLVACCLAVWNWHAQRATKRQSAIAAIVAAPNPLGWDYDPASLIRAVNAFHSLGRNDALIALKEFDARYPDEGYSCPHQSLELVMPLLFDRRNPDDKYPTPKNWFDPSEGIVLTEDSWRYWIAVEDGIPFHTVMISGTSGMPGNQSYLIEWADKHARLRESPMAPGDLFAAAEKVMVKLAEKEENDDSADWTNRHIRMQVYRSVKHLLNVADDDDELAPYDDERWDTFKERCEPLAIQWDETTQAFTSNAASSGR